MEHLSFWTPVNYSNPNNFHKVALQLVDSYFSLNGKKAWVIDKCKEKGAKGVIITHEEFHYSDLIFTALKVASYIIGFLPMLALKYALRRETHFFEIQGAYVPKQTDVSRTVHHYPGDLSKEAKANIKFSTAPKRVNIQFKEGLEVSVRDEDIFASGANTIVNAANSHLMGGGGIDGAIHKNGGIHYKGSQLALRSIYDGDYVSGHAAMIGSGDLNKKFKIENVIVVNGPSGVSNKENDSALYSCYFNSLMLAHENKIASIALPSISTGIFSFPKDRAAEISIRAIRDFIQKCPDSPLKTVSIHFQESKSLKFFEDALS